MSANSTSSLLDDVFAFNVDCLFFGPNFFIFTTFSITLILLLLPLCVFILHHGLQLWRQKRSTSSAATASHSDIFTYHLVVMELVGLLGCVLLFCGVCRRHLNTMTIGSFLSELTWFGETSFHILTCVERYLAVVHPITYLSLRNQRGIRIRNICIACVWLLCLVMTTLLKKIHVNVFVNFGVVLLSLIVISFCSLSVLCVLIRPGPGEQGGGRERVDQSKLRAFYTIVSILGVLVLRFAWDFIWSVVYLSSGSSNCTVVLCHYWFNLPSSLVLPLLFLHRAGKLVCCKPNIQ